MKTTAFILAFILFAFYGQAQEADNKNKTDEPTQYLFDGKISFSGFGGTIHEFSNLRNSIAYNSGGGGAVLLNQMIFIGGYGLSLSNDFNKEIVFNINDSITKTANYKLDMNHGGFWIGYIHNSKQLIHFCASAKFGWGRAAYYEPKYMMDYSNSEKYVCNFFVLLLKGNF